MLSARRRSDRQTVHAYFEKKTNGPFVCLDCNELVVLKAGRNKINHFAHANPLVCHYAEGESEAHRRCKMEIYQALLQEPNVTNVVLERPLGVVRPDVFAEINGVPVAIEVQMSSLSIETIMSRTIAYHQKGIYVLWLLQWTPKLDEDSYSPHIWEKWLHACYFGRVYYWSGGLNILTYHFDASLKTVPQRSWYSKSGKKMCTGGYSVRSNRFRRAIRGRNLNLVRDFGPKDRCWWGGRGCKGPRRQAIHDS